MVFSSRIFLFVFLPVVLLGYYLIHPKIKNIYLLFVSFAFYTWGVKSLVIVLLISIVLNYLSGLLIAYFKKKAVRLTPAIVALSISLNLLLLGYFKYYNFFISTIDGISGLSLPLKEIAIPLGISFFTFSCISYLLDLNLGIIEVEKNPISFALYVSFFPKLLQGPISRNRNISQQINTRETSLSKFSSGAYRFVVGLAKKVILADQLGLVVDQIFANPAMNNSIGTAWLGAVGYTLQIFFDFAGYTDMAIGLGKMFGFDIEENFNFPYISQSITEFWRRWHITLSSWFRDYVFTPLEFKRRKTKILRQETNTIIVFLLTGLWHGAGWTFVLWGLWHGLFILFERIYSTPKSKLHFPSYLKWLITMAALIVGWVLFRSPDLKYTLDYLGVMFGVVKSAEEVMGLSFYINSKVLSILSIGLIACVPWKDVFPSVTKRFTDTVPAKFLQVIFFLILLLASMMIVISSSYNAFLYFQF